MIAKYWQVICTCRVPAQSEIIHIQEARCECHGYYVFVKQHYLIASLSWWLKRTYCPRCLHRNHLRLSSKPCNPHQNKRLLCHTCSLGKQSMTQSYCLVHNSSHWKLKAVHCQGGYKNIELQLSYQSHPHNPSRKIPSLAYYSPSGAVFVWT